MSASRRTRLLLVAAAAVPVVLWSMPMVRARAKAVAVLADAVGLPFPRPFAPEVSIESIELAPKVTGDLYAGGEDAPVILLVPGAALKGREDERVIEAASALARAGRRVFVPELYLYQRTLRRADIERLIEAMVALSEDDAVGVIGFSYGGSLALLAAADERARGRIAYVATFGAYFELLHVIQGVTTGKTLLDGEEVVFPTLPEAREILTDAVLRLASGEEVEELSRALEIGDDRDLPENLDAIRDLLSNRDPRRTEELAAGLPARFRKKLERFSPASRINALDVPMFISQSKKDAATPWTEAVLLERSVDQSRLVLLEHFSHVDPPALAGWFRDGPKAWTFMSWVLEAQE